MRRRRRSLVRALWMLALVAAPCAPAAPMEPPVAPPAPGDLILRDGPPAVRRQLAAAPEAVRVDASFLSTAPEVLWLEPVPGEGRWAYRTEVERTAAGGLVWRGRFAEDGPGYTSVTLTLHDGDLAGSMELPGGATWRLQPRTAGGWELRADDPARFACGVGGGGHGAEAAPPDERGTATGGTAEAAAAAEREVYILVIYTPRARERQGAPRLEMLARHNVDLLNTAFGNSGIDGRAFLAAVVEADLGIAGVPTDQAAVDRAVAHPLAQELQDRWRADVVSVVVDDTKTTVICGWANIMYGHLRGPGFADSAYHVITDDCFGSNWVFTHETGHNFGAQHDPASASPLHFAAYPFSFAHGVDGHFRTLMAYPTACNDCRFVGNVFSTPLRSIDGMPAGIHDARDNARTIDLTFPLVASFRSGKPKPPPAPPPAAPTGLAAATVSPTEVALTWTDAAGDETGYEVDVLAEGGTAGWQRAAELPANTTAHTVGGLEPARAYRFRVRARRGNRVSGYSNEAAATTPEAVPAAPALLAVDPLSASAVNLRFGAVPRATGYEVEVRTADPAADRVAPLVLGDEGALVGGLAAAAPYGLRVRAVNVAGASDWSPAVHVTTFGPGGPCAADAATLCLLDGRFEVRARWRNPRAPFGHGLAAAQAAPGSERTGLFTFFDPANVELVVKMLDGRAANGAFWHFYGALSDVEYWVSVRDTADGAVRTYHNDPFEVCGRGDTTAFVPETPEKSEAPATLLASTVPARRVAAADGACVPGDEALCLAGGRFRVEVEWQNPHGTGGQGAGRVYGGLGGDVTGHFWFFRPDNLELAVKILDGRAINGHFWVLWGALSDVGYTIRVTDTVSGTAHDFENPPLTLCGGAVTNVL